MKTCIACLLIMFMAMPSMAQKEVVEGQDLTADDLKGTWKLVKGRYGQDTVFSYTADSVIYHKMITDTYFTWVQYFNGASGIEGMGGGTFEVVDGKYIENIDYFYPPGSSLLGTSIPFNCRIEGDKWYHEGYLKQSEIDPQTGEFIVVTVKLEEVWEKIE